MPAKMNVAQVNGVSKKKNEPAKFNDPMAVTWLEKHSDSVNYFWEKLPEFAKSCAVTIAVFLLGATIRGW